jgi:DNA-directed RNA polymerase specialized sigma24 family protein
MSGEIKSWWQARIAELERHGMLKRYANCAKEPESLFDRLGEDLASSNEGIRNAAFWIVILLTPQLTNLLHEKETWWPGWRDIKGKDQDMVNEGTRVLSNLHRALVKEHRFKARDGKKDPRPYLITAMNNLKKDVWRKDKKHPTKVELDYETTLEIPDPAGIPEDYVLEIYEELKSEYMLSGVFRNTDEFDMVYMHHVDDRPLEEIRERWGIPSDEAARQRLSRLNRHIVLERDSLFTLLLIASHEFCDFGRLPKFCARNPKMFWRWVKRVKGGVRPRAWLNGEAADGKNEVAIRALTSPLKKTPGHIYLVAVRRNFANPMLWFWHDSLVTNPNSLGPYLNYVAKQIDPTSRKLQPSRYMTRFLHTNREYELPGLNEALSEVPSEYIRLLVSYIPNSYRRRVEDEARQAMSS